MEEKIKKLLRKQHYEIVGEHSAVQICRWTKKSLLDEGFCYKQQFYNIKSHLCCQMTPSIYCPNQCLHCWRAIEFTTNEKIPKSINITKPKEIIEKCIEAQRKLLSGFKGNKKVNINKFKEAQEPRQFAISLIGEPTLYPHLGELIGELRKQKKTSFLVTNGLFPEKLKKLEKNRQLPTQLYISLNAGNEKLYNIWHKSKIKNAWKKFNKSLELIKRLKGKTRTVIRLTLVKDKNMKPEHVTEYAKLIKKATPDFVEVKAYMSVGFARKRLGYEKMPLHSEIKEFSKHLLKELNKIIETKNKKSKEKIKKYKILDEKSESRVVLLGQNRDKMRIKAEEI